VTVIAAFFLLGDRLGWLQLTGGIVALTGVYLATTLSKGTTLPRVTS
jgi:drug/metabolite transporter (DMT)-like permease